MTTRNDLLHAICCDPFDTAGRLMYADWLEENREFDRAEFVRVQVEGQNVSFRTYEATNGPDQPFLECDRWELSMPGDESAR